MSEADGPELQLRERRDAAADIIAEFEAGNLLRHHANTMLFEIFYNMPAPFARIEAAMEPFRLALDDVEAAIAARQIRSRAPSVRPDEQEQRRPSPAGSPRGSVRLSRNGEEGPTTKWPWSGKERVNDPELAKTLELRTFYREQLEKAKDAIVTSVGAPSFPESLWTSILKHAYVDFDKLNGSYYSAVNEEDGHAATIGEYTIRLKSKAATKAVTTSTDWLYCFESYERAVLWAFPHREKELRAYYAQFHRLFRSYASNAHIRLINLDRAIRSEIATSTLLKLTDPELFARLREQYLSVDGAGYQANSSSSVRGTSGGSSSSSSTSAKPSARTRPKVPEACIQWNSDQCRRVESLCLYLHKCSGCGGGHPQSKCPQTKSGGGGRVPSRE